MTFIEKIEKINEQNLIKETYSHRGVSEENNANAIENSINNNINVELDIQMTKDGKIILFHDPVILNKGIKFINNTTFEELKKIHPKIITIYELNKIKNINNINIMLDIKHLNFNPFSVNNFENDFLNKIILFLKTNPELKIKFQSFDILLIKELKSNLKHNNLNYDVGVIANGFINELTNKLIEKKIKFQPDFYSLENRENTYLNELYTYYMYSKDNKKVIEWSKDLMYSIINKKENNGIIDYDDSNIKEFLNNIENILSNLIKELENLNSVENLVKIIETLNNTEVVKYLKKSNIKLLKKIKKIYSLDINQMKILINDFKSNLIQELESIKNKIVEYKKVNYEKQTPLTI